MPREVESALLISDRIFGRYILLEELGRGGMGIVQKAWQMDLKRYVAIKFLGGTGDPQQLKRFYREAQTAAQLSHPNITSIYEISIQDGKHFIAMEYIDGVSLDDIEIPTDTANIRKIAFWIRDVSRAVDLAHKKGVIHRDIKPANIMLDKKEKPFVTDFGLARQIDADIKITKTGLVVGTPAFMSPEQAQNGGSDLDGSTDIWSIGATLYDLLTGRPPFNGSGAMETLSMVVHAETEPPSKFNPSIPKDLEAIVLKTLQKGKQSRYPAALDLARDLDRFLRGKDVLAKAPTLFTSGVRFAKKRKGFLFGIVFLLLIGTIWLSSSLQNSREIDRLYISAHQNHEQNHWAELLRICQEIETKGGGTPLITKYIQESKNQLTFLTTKEFNFDKRNQSQSLYRLAAQKLRETRSIASNAQSEFKVISDQYEQVIQLCKNSLEIDPGNQDALFALVEAYNDQRNPEGLPYSQKLVSLNNSDGVAWLHRARLLLWRYIRETGLIDDALIQLPTFDRRKEGNEILAAIDQALELGISEFYRDLAKGLQWFIEGDMEGAWNSFEEAYKKNPGDKDLALFRALCTRFAATLHGKLLPKETPYVSAAYQAQPNDLYSLYPYLHQILDLEPERVLKIISQISLPDNYVLQRIHFQALVRLNRTKDAGIVWDRIKMETLDPWAIYQYGKDDSPSELQEILDLLGKARKKHPLWSYFIDDYRTRILAKLDRFEECDEILKALLETRFFDRLAASNHEESRVYGNLAGIQHRKGNQNEAIRLALQSIGFFPRPHSYLVLAAAYYEKKEFQNSIDISLKALDIITPEYMAGLEKRFRQIIDQAKQWMEYEEN